MLPQTSLYNISLFNEILFVQSQLVRSVEVYIFYPSVYYVTLCISILFIIILQQLTVRFGIFSHKQTPNKHQ
jgi:hypothetical protein